MTPSPEGGATGGGVNTISRPLSLFFYSVQEFQTLVLNWEAYKNVPVGGQ